MTAEAGFNSPEEMQQAYNQMWEDIASGIGYVPQYFDPVCFRKSGCSAC